MFVNRATNSLQVNVYFTFVTDLNEKNALNRGRTDRISLTHDLDLQSPASYGHELLCGFEDRMETDGGDRITSLANAVVNIASTFEQQPCGKRL